MLNVLAFVLAANAVLHILSVLALRRQDAPQPQVVGVAAFVLVNAALAAGVASGATWALWGALVLPLVGGLGLGAQVARARKAGGVDVGILLCDLTSVLLSSIFLFA